MSAAGDVASQAVKKEGVQFRRCVADEYGEAPYAGGDGLQCEWCVVVFPSFMVRDKKPQMCHNCVSLSILYEKIRALPFNHPARKSISMAVDGLAGIVEEFEIVD